MLYLFRHGESLTNIKLDEVCNFPLNDDNTVLTTQGMMHAMDVGMRLKDQGVRPDIIFTSPLARARQTSYILASSMEHGCPIEVIDDLHEIVWHKNGVFERHENYRDIDGCFKTVDERPLPGLENQRDVYNRVVSHIPKLITEALSGKTVFCVSHYFVIRAIRAYLDHNDVEFMPHYDPKNVDPVIYTEALLGSLSTTKMSAL
jgi:broad specificity phosphatase PhoE